MNWTNIEINDVAQLKLDAREGTLEIRVPSSRPELEFQFRLSREVTRYLYVQLSRMQTILETGVEGSPPSGVRQ